MKLICLLLLVLINFNDANAGINCTVSVPTLNFGNYNFLNKINTTSTTAAVVTCSSNGWNESVGFELSVSTGSGTYDQRLMANASNKLKYNIYIDNTYKTIFGDASGGTSIITDEVKIVGFGPTTWPHTIYGKIPAGQSVPTGTYTDTMTVTVKW